MYLTKILLELTNPVFRLALSDSQKLHIFVTKIFNSSRKDSEILFCKRTCGNMLELYMYSKKQVMQDRLLPGMTLVAQRDLTQWMDKMEVGQLFRFRIMTMPFKKFGCANCKNGRRHALRTIEERLSWLDRKARAAGFIITNVIETPGDRICASHSQESGGRLIMDSWCYTGLLQIVDTEAFRKTLCQGIGPGKAYGLGMLVLSGE